MRVVAANSGCCGIKIIRDIPSDPATFVQYFGSSGHDEDQITTEPDPYSSWEELPPFKGEAHELIKLFVANIQERRPHGMIEINLVTERSYNYEDEDEEIIEENSYAPDAWRPYLTALGFTEVEFVNDNSGNIIHHFTLIY